MTDLRSDNFATVFLGLVFFLVVVLPVITIAGLIISFGPRQFFAIARHLLGFD